MNNVKYFESFEFNKKQFFVRKENIVGYHITFKYLLPKIRKIGLVPSVPEDMVDYEAVYLFKTVDDAKNALFNWLGERIDEMEEELGIELFEICLKVDLTGLPLFDSVEYEWVCPVVISPDRILSIFDI